MKIIRGRGVGIALRHREAEHKLGAIAELKHRVAAEGIDVAEASASTGRISFLLSINRMLTNAYILIAN